MRRLILVGVAAAFCATATEARAETLRYDGLGKADVVTVAGSVSGSFYAGELNWTWLGATPVGFDTSFYSYCVDLLNDVVNPQNVTIRSTTEMPTTAPGGAAKAAYLLNTFSQAIRTGGTAVQAAALQVAIWEAIYDPVLDLSNGNFQLITEPWAISGQATALAIYNQASQYLQSLGTGQYANATAIWLDAPVPGQDQITSVPEPAALLLLGIGALVAARFSRGRRRALAAPVTTRSAESV